MSVFAACPDELLDVFMDVEEVPLDCLSDETWVETQDLFIDQIFEADPITDEDIADATSFLATLLDEDRIGA